MAPSVLKRQERHDLFVPVSGCQQNFKFIDLFAGVGGFHLALANLNAECVFACEVDPSARQTYLANHIIAPELFAEDIQNVDPLSVPDHDILCAGFPCQPFSQAGFKNGFADIRGTLFYNIMQIVDAKKPAALFLENVRHLKNHDEGRTFATIEQEIKNRGYNFYSYIVKGTDHNIPQHRPRLFMIAFRDGLEFQPPAKEKLNRTMSDILGGKCNKEIGYTLRVGGRGSHINDRHNWDSYLVDGTVYKISAEDAKIMQGFPADFILPVSKSQAMKQMGNSVVVPAIQAYAQQIIQALQRND